MPHGLIFCALYYHALVLNATKLSLSKISYRQNVCPQLASVWGS